MKQEEKLSHMMQDHLEVVRLLLKPSSDILDTMDSGKCNLMHLTFGIVGEIGELMEAMETARRVGGIDLPNVKEEMGDLEFYLLGLRDHLCYFDEPSDEVLAKSFPEPFRFQNIEHIINRMMVSACQLMDYVKKSVAYNSGFKLDAALTSIDEIQHCLNALYANLYMITRPSVLAENKEKLMKKRYPNGYSDEAAQARADKN